MNEYGIFHGITRRGKRKSRASNGVSMLIDN
jgi:hypothetical protein